MFARFRWASFILAAVLFLGAGCKKSNSNDASRTSGLSPGETVLSLHWLGKGNIVVQTNSGYFMGIWQKPESLKLQSHFLDQLSLAPLHLLTPQPPGARTKQLASETNQASAKLLRPLLDDLVQNEWFLELSRGTDGTTDFGLAMRLPPEKATLWVANLPKAFDSITNAPGVRKPSVECSRYEGWTFVGIGGTNNRALGGLQVRMTLPRIPSAPGAETPWLDGEANLQKLLPPGAFPIGLPDVKLAIAGQPQGVATRALFNFPQPLPFEVEPWQIPTNLIHGPNFTLTAVQGVGPLISSLKFWKDLQIGPAPNQLFFWAHVAHPALTYVAAPMKDARNSLAVITDLLLTKGNSWLATNGTGQFERSKDYEGVFCTAGNPLLGPFLKRDTNVAPNVLLAGWGTSNSTNSPPPDFLFKDLATSTNLVFYDREMTGSRIGAWFYLAQGLRVILWKAQVPFDSASVEWLQNPGKMFGTSTTWIRKTGPSQLTLDRTSSVGLNSVELQFLADYLESPQFPCGVHTTRSPGMKSRARPRARLNPSSSNSTNK